MQQIRFAKLVYFLAAISFHLVLLFTDAGNYFHGGSAREFIALQAAGVLLIAAAFKLITKSSTPEKMLILLCSVIPAISIGMSFRYMSFA